MTCPAAGQLDRSLDDPELLAELRDHLSGCAECRALHAVLGELPELLAAEAVWEDGEHLDEAALLAALSGEAPAHVARCAPCQDEVEALRAALDDAPRVSSELEGRLRGLVDGGRGSQRLRVHRGGSARVGRSGSARISGSGRRRRSARLSTRRAIQRPGTPPWAWVTLVAAASILVLLALVLRPAPPAQVAQAPSAVPSRAPSRPASPASPAPATPRPTQLDPAYPLPAASPDAPTPAPEPSATPAPDASPDAPTPTQTTPSVAPSAEPAAPLPPIHDDGGSLQVARLGGAAERLGADGWEPLAPGRLSCGDRVRAGDAGALISLEEGRYEVCLAPGSEAAVRETVDGAVLDLVQGALRAEVVSLVAGERFDVQTRQGRFGVLGTIFTVEDQGDDPSRLLVSEGTVAAQGQRGRGEASAGEALLVATRVAPTPFDAEALRWAEGLAPRRETLQAVGFADRGDRGDFSGELAAGWLRLELLDGDPTWGVGTRASGWRQAAGADLYLKVVVTSRRDVTCRVQARNATQDKLVQAELALTAGRQRTLTIPVLALKTDYDPARNPVRPGDALEDLRILAGGPGEAPDVRVDEVSVYRKVYR